MKTKKFVTLIVILVSIGLLLTSCDMINDFIESRTRPIPLIQLYNSNLEKTLKMMPNDTLYVQVQGLEPDKDYTVQVLDPTNNLISEMTAVSNAEGVIGLSPIWYDIGFRQDPDTMLMTLGEADLGLRAFNVRVFDQAEEARAAGNTDFQLPFFIVTDNSNFDRPQPIVMAGKRVDPDGAGSDPVVFAMENSFFSDSVADPSDDQFYPTGTEPAEKWTNILYIQAEAIAPLIEGQTGKNVRIWILPFPGDPFPVGEYIANNAYFYIDYTVLELMDAVDAGTGVHIPWPQTQPYTAVDVGTSGARAVVATQEKIPAWAEEKAFSVFLDMMDNDRAGIYEVLKEGTDSFYLDSIDGNGVPGFIVKKPPVDLDELQLASGGMFRYEYNSDTNRYGYNYDYRDTFVSHGQDTKWAYGYWNYRLDVWGKGVKAIWNPYITYSWASWYNPPEGRTSLYYGRWVDVYIANADPAAPANGTVQDTSTLNATIHQIPHTTKKRVPVQYGCSNGWNMQTIWRAPLVPGDYFMIVDFNGDGNLDDGDLIDNIRDDEGLGGFGVYQ